MTISQSFDVGNAALLHAFDLAERVLRHVGDGVRGESYVWNDNDDSTCLVNFLRDVIKEEYKAAEGSVASDLQNVRVDLERVLDQWFGLLPDALPPEEQEKYQLPAPYILASLVGKHGCLHDYKHFVEDGEVLKIAQDIGVPKSWLLKKFSLFSNKHNFFLFSVQLLNRIGARSDALMALYEEETLTPVSATGEQPKLDELLLRRVKNRFQGFTPEYAKTLCRAFLQASQLENLPNGIKRTRQEKPFDRLCYYYESVNNYMSDDEEIDHMYQAWIDRIERQSDLLPLASENTIKGGYQDLIGWRDQLDVLSNEGGAPPRNNAAVVQSFTGPSSSSVEPRSYGRTGEAGTATILQFPL